MKAFRERPQQETYPVLWVDSLYEKIRVGTIPHKLKGENFMKNKPLSSILIIITLLILGIGVSACAGTSSELAEEPMNETAIVGPWMLADNKNDEFQMRTLFGSSKVESSGMEIMSNGQISFNIGYGFGGEGTYTRNGNTVTTTISNYAEGAKETVVFQVLEEDNIIYLTMEVDGETIYWTQG